MKRNKRYIPKEGMPRAHKAYQKKEKRCIPKEGMPHTHKVCQKRERERKRKYSPYIMMITLERDRHSTAWSFICEWMVDVLSIFQV